MDQDAAGSRSTSPVSPRPYLTTSASSVHDVPHAHHADVLVLDDVAVEHGHARVVHDGDQDADAAPLRHEDDVLPGRHGGVEGGVAGVPAGDGEHLAGLTCWWKGWSMPLWLTISHTS